MRPQPCHSVTNYRSRQCRCALTLVLLMCGVAVFAETIPATRQSKSWTGFFRKTLEQEWGVFLTAALYDERAVNAYRERPDSLFPSVPLPKENANLFLPYEVMKTQNRESRDGYPFGLSTAMEQLAHVKLSLSVAVGRLEQDHDLRQLFSSHCEDQSNRVKVQAAQAHTTQCLLFEEALRRVLSALLQHAVTACRLVLISPPFSDEFRSWLRRFRRFQVLEQTQWPKSQSVEFEDRFLNGHDPLWALMSAIDVYLIYEFDTLLNLIAVRNTSSRNVSALVTGYAARARLAKSQALAPPPNEYSTNSPEYKQYMKQKRHKKRFKFLRLTELGYSLYLDDLWHNVSSRWDEQLVQDQLPKLSEAIKKGKGSVGDATTRRKEEDRTEDASPQNPAYLRIRSSADAPFYAQYFDYERVNYMEENTLTMTLDMLQPPLSCFSLTRECETTDGCRYYCNLEFLQFASVQDQSGDPQPFYHRFMGFGSDNDFDWEVSIKNKFEAPDEHTSDKAKKNEKQFRNRIYSMTSFDCTLSEWRPPAELREPSVAWGGAKFCIGDKTTNASGLQFVSYDTLKHHVLSAEGRASPYPNDLGSSNEASALDMADMIPQWKRGEIFKGKIPPEIHPAGQQLFHEVSILKIDIEGNEFSVLDAWMKAERRSIGSTLLKLQEASGDGRTSNLFSVSIIVMELHFWFGFPKIQPMDHVSMWHVQHLLFHQALPMGYIAVSLEKNNFVHNSFEIGLVHWTYYVRSEMWMQGSRLINN